MQRPIEPIARPPGIPASPSRGSLFNRLIKRGRAFTRFNAQRLSRYYGALVFSAVLAVVGLLLFSPLPLDDLVSRTSSLLHPSQDAVTITEPTLISEHPLITVISGTLSVPSSVSGKVRTGDSLAALVKGGSARLALDNPVVQLELSPTAHDEFGFDAILAASPLLAALEEAAFESLIIRDGTVLLKSAGGRVDTLRGVNADVSVKRKTAVRVKGSATLNGEVLILDATFGARIGRRGSSRMPVRATLQSGPLKVSLDGRLDVGNGLQLSAPAADIAISQVRSLARWFGHLWPSGPGLKDFTAHGALEWSGQTIAIPKGVFKIDGNDANGTLALTFGGSRPALAGTLAFQAVDLRAYLPADPLPGAKALIAQLKATRDITLPLIGMLDADVRMSAETLSVGAFQAGRSAALVALHDGQLLVNLADMVLPGGGSATGELAIQGSITLPNYTVHGRLDGVELASLTADLVGTPLLRGLGQVVFDLRASGGAGIDVLSRLSGRIEVKAPDGATAACSIKDLAAAAPAADDAPAAQICRSSTALDPFMAKLILTNGIVNTGEVGATAGSDQVRLNGTIDLVTRIMDLTVTASPALRTQIEPSPRDVIAIRGRPELPTIVIQQP